MVEVALPLVGVFPLPPLAAQSVSDGRALSVLDLLGFLSGEDYSGVPPSVSPVLGVLLSEGSRLMPDRYRGLLIPGFLDALGTRSSELEAPRARVLLGWSLGVLAQALIEVGLVGELEELPEVSESLLLQEAALSHLCGRLRSAFGDEDVRGRVSVLRLARAVLRACRALGQGDVEGVATWVASAALYGSAVLPLVWWYWVEVLEELIGWNSDRCPERYMVRDRVEALRGKTPGALRAVRKIAIR